MTAIEQFKFVEILNDIYEELGMRKDIVDFDVYKDHIVPLRDPSIFNEDGSKNRKRLREIQAEINNRIATGQYDPKPNYDDISEIKNLKKENEKLQKIIDEYRKEEWL